MQTLAELYLDECGGSSREYRDRLTKGERMGQAFFNSLSSVDQYRLRGTMRDTYHRANKDSAKAIERAIEFLMGD